mgnify:FL=1
MCGAIRVIMQADGGLVGARALEFETRLSYVYGRN